jgi:predicted PurR-regulated permease PerM
MSEENTRQNDIRYFPAMEITIRLGVVILLFSWCFQIISPFVMLILWGAVIAVAVHPLFLKLAARFGGKEKLAVTFIVLVGLGIIIVPTVMLSESLVETAATVGEQVHQGTFKVSPPPEKVKEWPVVGAKTYAAWQKASDNLQAFYNEYSESLKAVGTRLLGAVASAGASVLQFILAMLIAGVFLSTADLQKSAVNRFARRLAPTRGEELVNMSSATIRSIAVGVLGIAFIQAVLAAAGMLVAGVPATAVWTLLVLLVAIVQLPPILILLPVALWVFGSTDNQVLAWGFLIWSILVSFADMLLKPLLLGRGVDVPMLVILLGAIGGMIMSGIIGLFLGAVVLALGYKIFMLWLEMGETEQAAEGKSVVE